MHDISKTNETPNLDYIDSMEDIATFYERPEGVNRNITEIAPKPGETDDDFIKRSSGEFARQYPGSSKADRVKMGKLTLEAERQQIMHQEHEKSQQEHETLTDSGYREELANLQEEYQTTIRELDSLSAKGVLKSKTVQDAKADAKLKWLDGRKKASEQYDIEYHKQADIGTPSAEEVERFRKQEMEDLNQKHEQIINFEAERLGIISAFDSGLIAKLAEGSFSKYTSVGDFGDTIQRGMGRETTLEEDRFIGALWKPEIVSIKHNAVMRAIASPIRSKNVIGNDGTSHDENHFVLPIDNPDFTEYVSENVKKDDGVKLAICAGLSEALNYGTRDEAIKRARWFYEMAHEEAGLSSEDVLAMVEASGIVRGNDGSQKWRERLNDFTMEIIDWNEAETQPDEQDSQKTEENPEDVQEIKIAAAQLLEDLKNQLQQLKQKLNVEYISMITATKDDSEGGNNNRSGGYVDNITNLARQIVLINRQIQHIAGTQYAFEIIKDGLAAEIKVEEPKYFEGKWKSDSCIYSAFKLSSPKGDKEAWAFICEGTTREQELFYGIQGSLEDIKDLFNNKYYRRRGESYRPNIKDVNGVRWFRHSLTLKNMEEMVSNEWSTISLNDLRKDEPIYRKIATDFYDQIIENGLYTEPTKKIDDIESTNVQNAEDSAEKIEPSTEELETSAEENMPPEEIDIPIEKIVPPEEIETLAEESEVPIEETTPQIKDKELFNLILSKQSGISNRGRKTLHDRSNNLQDLLRTPKGPMRQMLTEPDIRRLMQVLDENGREPQYDWLGE